MRVHGEGNRSADVMCIAEAPGEREDQLGRPMVGKSGREYDRYLEQAAKIPRRKVWTTNLVKERPATFKVRGNSPPTTSDIERDEPELIQELIDVQPAWICCIGRYSARYFLGSVSIEDTHGFAYPVRPAIKSRILAYATSGLSTLPHDSTGSRKRKSVVDSDLQSKMRDYSEWLDRLKVVVVTHPAAGLHNSGSQPDIWHDFKRLGEYVRGELDYTPPVDQYPDPDYYIQRTAIAKLPTPHLVAVDTESRLDGTRIWGGSYSFHPGSGAVVKVGDRHLLPSFRDMLYTHRVVCHNLPHDARVLCKWLGISIYEFFQRVDAHCSMQMAFVHRLLPRGLKPLMKRFEGMPAVGYHEVVGPADQRLAEEYLLKVLQNKCGTCGGTGQQIEDGRVHKSSGKPLEPRVVNCAECEGDGTGWEPPSESFEWDAKKKRIRLSRGQRIGTRVRKALENAQKKIDGAGDGDADGSPADDDTEESTEGDEKAVVGLRRWWTKQVDFEFRLQVEDQLGPMPEATLDDIDPRLAVDYAARDADGLIRVEPKIEQMIRNDGLYPVYEQDLRAMPMICQMMNIGWKIDVPYLQELSSSLTTQMDVIEHQLEQVAGHFVNPASTNQVGDLLFDELGMEPIRLNEHGPSTDNKVLKDLFITAASRMDDEPKMRRAYDCLELIMGHRERSKLRSTYTTSLARSVDGDNRVHTDIKMAVVETRRLASRNPNLQNIPRRTSNGRLVRHAFTCIENTVLLECDLSQIEMRILAHESGEKSLIKAIREGLDVHALTTSKIFGIPIGKVTKSMWQRDAAKTLGFAIVYDVSAISLRVQIKLESGKDGRTPVDVPEQQCQQWIDDYKYKSFPAIGEYMADSIAEAKRYGYVTDMWGHRRYLPGVSSELYGVRRDAERIACNTRIQSGASGVIKEAMAATWTDVLPKFRKRGYVEPLMQIHDSIVVEIDRGLVEEFKSEVLKVMANVVKLKVPITADGKIGVRWSELE